VKGGDSGKAERGTKGKRATNNDSDGALSNGCRLEEKKKKSPGSGHTNGLDHEGDLRRRKREGERRLKGMTREKWGRRGKRGRRRPPPKTKKDSSSGQNKRGTEEALLTVNKHSPAQVWRQAL